MNKVYCRILKIEESQKRNTIWYSLGMICSSAASMILLLVVTRILGKNLAGIFSLAWSAAQLMLTIGWFSMRQYQVSDVNEKYSFYDYLYTKILSSVIMISCAVVYVFIYNYDFYQKIVTLLLCVLMITEVFADFSSGFFQHKGKLHIGGKSYIVRNICYVLVFAVTLWIKQKLCFSIICAIIVAAGCLLIFDYPLSKHIDKHKTVFSMKKSVNLLAECMPLTIGAFIASFIMNVPKNAIYMYMDNNAQACYNVLFMPSAVINMLNMFICVPFYDKLALLWWEGQKKKFMKMIFKMIGLVVFITGLVLIGGASIGIPVLSWLYNIELKSYRLTFVILLLGGGIYGIISILTYVITVWRKQKVVLYVYIVVACLVQIAASFFVHTWGITGAALMYTAAMLCISTCFMVFVYVYINNFNREQLIE